MVFCAKCDIEAQQHMFAIGQAQLLNRALASASALSAGLCPVAPVHARCGGCPFQITTAALGCDLVFDSNM